MKTNRFQKMCHYYKMFNDATFSINILKITLRKDSISVDRKKELAKLSLDPILFI